MVNITEYDSADVLCPTVLWSQRKETISLKVNVMDAKSPKIELTESSLRFQVEATGANGSNLYEFSLEFYKNIDKESCVYKVTPAGIDLHLTKEGKGKWWPRLISETAKKPHFLKLNFDKWITESDEEKEVQKKNEKQKTKSLQDSNDKTSQTSDMIVNFYLALYNTAQLLLFTSVFLSCCLGVLFKGPEFRTQIFSRLGGLVTFAVLLSYLETVHSMLKYVKSPWFLPFIQVSGRSFALLCLWLSDTGVQEGWAVWYLFMAWSGAEVIRYPTYLLQILKQEFTPITWLRYHAWILLYPLGGFCEYTILSNAAVFFEEYGLYAYKIPGPLSFTFGLANFIRVYVIILVIGLTVLMRHMWKMRQLKFGRRRKFKST